MTDSLPPLHIFTKDDIHYGMLRLLLNQEIEKCDRVRKEKVVSLESVLARERAREKQDKELAEKLCLIHLEFERGYLQRAHWENANRLMHEVRRVLEGEK